MKAIIVNGVEFKVKVEKPPFDGDPTHEVFAPDGFTFDGAHSLHFWSMKEVRDHLSQTELDAEEE